MSQQTIKYIHNQHKSEAGFTLIEVIVAALMVFFFVAGAMQALALSVAIRVQAQERQRADQLIQEDVEQIRLVAENMSKNHSLCTANGYSGGYAEALTSEADFPANGATKYLIEGNTKSRQYQLDRTVNPASTNTVLKLNYEVKEVGETRVIATDYIEVIPNEAIQCP